MDKKMEIKNLIPSIVEELDNTPATSDETTYIGFAAPDGNADTLRDMLIMRAQYINATGITTIQYAEGSRNFDKVWADRATYDYSNLKEGV